MASVRWQRLICARLLLAIYLFLLSERSRCLIFLSVYCQQNSDNYHLFYSFVFDRFRNRWTPFLFFLFPCLLCRSAFLPFHYVLSICWALSLSFVSTLTIRRFHFHYSIVAYIACFCLASFCSCLLVEKLSELLRHLCLVAICLCKPYTPLEANNCERVCSNKFSLLVIIFVKCNSYSL